jgi:hypothetical protein
LTTYNITILNNNTYNGIQFTIKKNGIPINLTGANIIIQVKSSFVSTNIEKEFSVGSGITITNPTQGMYQIDAQVITMHPGVYVYDTLFIFADDIQKTYEGGVFTVKPVVTNG